MEKNIQYNGDVKDNNLSIAIKDIYIAIYNQEIEKIEKARNEAIAENKETFSWEEEVIDVEYGKHLIEHLKSRLSCL